MSYELTKPLLDEYLKELSKEIKKEYGRQVHIELIVVGGAAIVLKEEFRQGTTDVDGIVAGGYSIKAPIQRVALKYGLSDTWLNDEFKQTTSYSKNLSFVSKPYKTFNQVLYVRTIEAEYLVAMKLMSFRQYKTDLSDIVGIIHKANIKGRPLTRDLIEHAVITLYDTVEKISKEAWLYLDKVLTNEYSYETVRMAESVIKTKLTDTLKQYDDMKLKDVIGSLNALDYINRTSDDRQADTECKLEGYHKYKITVKDKAGTTQSCIVYGKNPRSAFNLVYPTKNLTKSKTKSNATVCIELLESVRKTCNYYTITMI